MIRSVVHFIDTMEFGGAEQALLLLLQGLDRERWRPVLFHHDEPGLRPLLDFADAAGISRRCVEPMRGPRHVDAIPGFARAVRAERPAVFHAHLNWPLACSGGILAAALSRVPAIVATVQLFSHLPRAATIPLQRSMVTRAVSRYIAVSRAVARDVERTLHVPSTRIRVVPNGVALERFAQLPPSSASVRLDMAGRVDRPIVLTLARLDKHKGLSHLLKAAAQVPDVSFVVAGQGPEQRALEAEAYALGVADRVSFIGFRRDTPALLANADLFVLPSLLEGLPLAVLEAMASGRPVIATAIGGTDEVVRHAVTGWCVPPADPDALAAAIRLLLCDSGLAKSLARAGQALVHEQFSAPRAARSVMAIYDELLGDPRGASAVTLPDAAGSA